MPAPSDGDRLAALGHEVRLLDDSRPRIRYSLRSMHLLEQRFGSLAAAIEAFEALDGEDAMRGPAVGTILDVLGAGLVDSGFVPHTRERVVPVRTTYPDGRVEQVERREVAAITYVRQRDRVELGSLFDFGTVTLAMDAIARAFAEAMPTVGEAQAPAAIPMPGPMVDSLGRPFTTSAPSSSAAPTPSSGG